MVNEHGLDTHYFKKKLSLIVRDIDCYTPSEMCEELKRLSLVAKEQDEKSWIWKLSGHSDVQSPDDSI
ncbi:hypothetical protein tloyanaT_25840 [Thalassotalea loyana]|uniref:Uncharacterized protein n=1 Tax=Thalassotalea loyana TaxID=280483 RepID=A0ABQ6HIA7_9GAMM|nr:hypothetical protein [Thalassotalea loyana]GLX86331.1 hypothetical protein tloyanaT_25840 [Thalassotalea loyana]